MDITSTTLQEEFLNRVANNRVKVSLYLVNGIRLNGQIMAHDQHTVSLTGEGGGEPQLVYKHAIATIRPGDSGTDNRPRTTSRV